MSPDREPQIAPLYRLYQPAQGDHLYTSSSDERYEAIATGGYLDEGVVGYVAVDPGEGFIPLFRLDGTAGLHDHYYTISPAERQRAAASGKYEGIRKVGFVPADARRGHLPFFALHHPGTDRHFYTTTVEEREIAIERDGYAFVGTACHLLLPTGSGGQELGKSLAAALRESADRALSLTVMFTDVQNSSALNRALGNDRWVVVRGELIGIGRELLDERTGCIVKTAGDGILAAFSSPTEAVRFALEYQRQLRSFNEERPSEPACLLRIGIHQGEVTVALEDESLDLLGNAVNRTERIETVAEGGRVLMSRDVYRAVVDRAPPWAEQVVWEDRGLVELKGYEPEDLVELIDAEAPSLVQPRLTQGVEVQRPGLTGPPLDVSTDTARWLPNSILQLLDTQQPGLIVRMAAAIDDRSEPRILSHQGRKNVREAVAKSSLQRWFTEFMYAWGIRDSEPWEPFGRLNTSGCLLMRTAAIHGETRPLQSQIVVLPPDAPAYSPAILVDLSVQNRFAGR